MTARSHRFGPLREREFRLLFTGQLISLAGTAMAPIALAFAVLDLGTASDLGFVLAAGWAPQIVFILVGGVWADRLPRNLVIVAANVVSGAAQSVIACLLLLDRAQLWHLIALQIVRGIATSFFFPASAGVVPHTVAAGRLQQANALLRLSQNTTNILGALAAGALVATIGSGWAIAFDAATYFASAAVLARMRVRGSVDAGERSFLRELTEGWQEFTSRTWLWVVVLAASVGNLVWVGGQAVLGPVVAKESLGGAAGWGGVAGESAGLVVGSLVALRWRPGRPLFAGVILLGTTPFFLAALAIPIGLPFMIAVAAVAGFGLEIFNVNWITTMHEQIPDEVLARVNSYDALGSFVFIPVGLTVAGPAADAIGASGTLWAAAGIALVMMLGALLSRDVRQLERLHAAPGPVLPDAEPLPPPIH
jgi:MFS family permease